METADIDAMMETAKTMYPDMNEYLLRIALHTAIQDDEMRKKRKLKKGEYLTDKMEKEIRTYEKEYKGLVEIIPPENKEEEDAPHVAEVEEHIKEITEEFIKKE